MRRRDWWLKSSYRKAIGGAIALHLAFGLIYLFLGQPNADEGWYLYASKLVFEGKIPYCDFAFTQMPLLPYIYGLPQFVLKPSLYLGRATSMALSIGNLLLSVLLAHRYAADRGGALAALLSCSFTYGIYFQTIVKTYALLSVLFTLTCLVLSSNVSDTWKYPLAVILSYLAAMVRLSAVFFLLPVAVYSLAAASSSRRALTFTAMVSLAAAIGSLIFFQSCIESVQWNLLTHHIEQWGDMSYPERAVQILALRVPSLVVHFIHYFFLAYTVSFFALRNEGIRRRIRPYLRENTPVAVIALGLVLFGLSHFGTGGWHMEYFVPAVVSFFPIIAITYSKVLSLQDISSSKLLLQGVLFIVLLVALLRQSVRHLDLSGGKLPIEKIKEISVSISRHTDPSDSILVLEALWTAVESDRSVLPGMTMAQFSYQNMTTKEAEKTGLVNSEIILDYIRTCSAEAVVLTDYDWRMFAHNDYDKLIREALLSHYRLILTREAFGQRSESVYLYLPDAERCAKPNNPRESTPGSRSPCPKGCQKGVRWQLRSRRSNERDGNNKRLLPSCRLKSRRSFVEQGKRQVS